ncbi:hypothetical protein PHYC_01656 [Phycisphaerales bacterium]|nr:hypothetical protein PHYC_01656 [Phycisphaerales bacterium]
MSLVRGVKCSASAAGVAAAAWAGVAVLSGASLAVFPMMVGAAAGLGMAVSNRGKDGTRAGVSAAVVACVGSIVGWMGLSAMQGEHANLNPFRAVADMGPMGIMWLVVGACAAWWLGGRETPLSASLSATPVVRRVSEALDGPLGAISRDVDDQKKEMKKAA